MEVECEWTRWEESGGYRSPEILTLVGEEADVLFHWSRSERWENLVGIRRTKLATDIKQEIGPDKEKGHRHIE